MPVTTFGEFLPDLPTLGNPGVVVARNVVPDANGFSPVPEWQASSDALDARPRGAIRTKDLSGGAHSYAADATKAYEISGTSWGDVTNAGGAYTTGDNERWEFVRWSGKVLATNFSDNPQQITMGGANFTDLTSAFRARHIAVVRNQVIAGNTFDSSDGEVQERLRFSAFNDETDWTPSAATLADFTDLISGGAIQRITGGEFGVVFQEESIRRLTFVGSPTVFQIDEVLPGVGLLAPGAVVRAGRVVYFLSRRGFIALVDGTQENRIGANKVDRFVLDDIDDGNLHRVSAAHDPVSGRVWFGYPGSGNVAGRPNKIAIYDRNRDRWSGPIEMEHELLWSAGGVGIDLDTTDTSAPNDDDLDAVNISFDSDRYKGAGQNIQAFDENFKTGAFDGEVNMVGRIVTGEREFTEGRNTRINAFRPVVEGGTITARIGTRQTLQDEISFGSELSLTNGRFTKRSNARYHSFRFDISGDWERAIGYQIARGEARPGERRA